MASTVVLVSLLLGVAVLLLIKFAFTSKRSNAPLPPGPKPKPLVGNLFDLPGPDEADQEHWAKHKDLYGPLSSVSFFGTTIVIINDAEIAFELLERRGNVNSGRPTCTFGNELSGYSEFLGQQNYDGKLKNYRKRVSQMMGSKTGTARFNPLQDIESRRFLLRVLYSPHDWCQHLRTQAGAVILKITYGYRINPHGYDEFVWRAEEAIRHFTLSVLPGKWMVDIIPALKYIPAWVPGADFQRTAAKQRAHLYKTVDPPIAFVKQRMAAGDYEPSFVSDNYAKAKGPLSVEDEHAIKWSAASLYVAGADTTVSTLEVFFQAMTIHPEVQRKAQEEIDRVVGTHRLPSMSDRENLPYVDALVNETIRWHPIVPTGFPHVADRDNTYNGYLIPKGAYLLTNLWGFSRDPKAYPNPSEFDPERFLANPTPPDPRHFIFGHGRRVCPGRLLADVTVWLTIAKTLAAYNISRPVDRRGREVVPEAKFTPGFLSHPVPFKTVITPRSGKHEMLIRAVEIEHPWEKGDSFEKE